MTTIPRNVSLLACSAMASIVIVLAGCKPASTPEPTATPVPSETLPADQPDPARPAAPDELARGRMPGGPEAGLPERDTAVVDTTVEEVRLSNRGDTEEHTLGAPTATFGPTDTVYAEIQTTGTAAAYTLYAKWIAADGAVLADYGMRINEPGLKRTVISLSKPDGWPRGQNNIELAINGQQQRTVSFTVQ